MAPEGIALAATWQPRGELPRLLRLGTQLQALYPAGICIALPPEAESRLAAALAELPGVTIRQGQPWPGGRHTAVAAALETPASHIHYCDLDRLLHWVEVYPAELSRTLEAIRRTPGCVVLGRTERAWATHPRAMFETESIFNLVFSRLAGMGMDFGAGSKGFSRSAAAYALEHNPPPATSFAVDAGWPLILQRAGFPLEYLPVEGLEWETPDQQQGRIASTRERQQAAEEADQAPAFWQARLEVAQNILYEGLEALRLQSP
jgi:hypothetical protein